MMFRLKAMDDKDWCIKGMNIAEVVWSVRAKKAWRRETGLSRPVK